MVKYKRLSMMEREELSRYLAMNHTYCQIARHLHRSVSTIAREVSRNQGDPKLYRAMTANQKAYRLKTSGRWHKLDQNEPLRDFVLSHLKKRWSPQQIAKHLKKLYSTKTMHISHQTIYAYVYVQPRGRLKQQLIGQLRRKHSQPRSHKTRIKSYPIQDYVSIEQRPAEVNQRKVFGHWEGDLIMGPLNRSAIGTLVERITRFTLLVKLPKKDAASVRVAFQKTFESLPPSFRKSLTYDQGQEMAEHKLFTQATNIQVYFAHPHSPWERGTSENTNMLVRDFFPKGTDFSRVSAKKLKQVQDLLNERPRKILDWNSPDEVFNVALQP